MTDVSSGTYTFVDVLAPGSADAERLSRIVIYSYPGDDDDDTDVPEPGTLALLGLGLMGLGMLRRRR